MELIYQGKGTSICGQCCVAMVTGKKLLECLEALHDGGTFGVELIKMIKDFGFKCSDKLKFPVPEHLPEKCILRIKYEGYHGGHWVAYYKGFIYDPSFKYGIVEISHYKKEFLEQSEIQGRFISYLEIKS